MMTGRKMDGKRGLLVGFALWFYLLVNKPDIFNSRTRKAETDESVGSQLAWSTQQVLQQPGTCHETLEGESVWEGKGGEMRGLKDLGEVEISIEFHYAL